MKKEVIEMASTSKNSTNKKDETNLSMGNNQVANKRVADESPEKPVNKKRSVFGDLTNAITQGLVKKNGQIVKKPEKKSTRKTRQVKDDVLYSISESKVCKEESPKSSQEVTADEDSSCAYSTPRESLSQGTPIKGLIPELISESETSRVLPPGVDDYDKDCINDPFSEPKYAMDIFNYYRERELQFPMDKYMSRQPELSKGMRAVLADWLVEVQESFELNHETLYLAVKLVDHYLKRKSLPKASLQLLGATATFLACKFDERCPPLVDDFLYICDDAYTRQQLIRMEMDIIKTLDFDLGIPLSYRFLRRFARCSKVSMEILTLARYILETALLEYDLIGERDSHMAAAALHLALRMKGDSAWTPTMQYYSGYQEKELLDLERRLNRMITTPAYKNLVTVRTKYTHKVFLEVAKIPPLPLDDVVPV